MYLSAALCRNLHNVAHRIDTRILRISMRSLNRVLEARCSLVNLSALFYAFVESLEAEGEQCEQNQRQKL